MLEMAYWHLGGGPRQGCKMAFVLPLAISAPASLARIRPCLSLRWRIFTFGNCDMYLSNFSLRYSAGKEERMRRSTDRFRTHFQGEKQRADFPWKCRQDTPGSPGLGRKHLGTAAGLLVHGVVVRACSPAKFPAASVPVALG